MGGSPVAERACLCVSTRVIAFCPQLEQLLECRDQVVFSVSQIPKSTDLLRFSLQTSLVQKSNSKPLLNTYCVPDTVTSTGVPD